MSETTDFEADVLALLRAHIGDEVEITPETKIIGDTKMDSVAVMDFVLEIEDHFDITIPLNRLADVTTVKDLLEAVSALRNEHP